MVRMCSLYLKLGWLGYNLQCEFRSGSSHCTAYDIILPSTDSVVLEKV